MHGDDPSPPGSVSQQVGKMAEQIQQQQQGEVPDHPQFRQSQAQEEEGPVRRGDGTILKESDKPRNPKKKMWEENVESEKYERAQAEQTQQQQAGSSEGEARRRDEL